MKRPDQHITADRGSSLMREVFAELGWAVNRVESDYGLDFDIEVFRANESTGVFFKVQLKSSRSTSYSAAGTFVAQDLEAPNARYLCHEVRAPVVLLHADVEWQRLFWTAPQLLQLANSEAVRNPTRKRTTVRVPTANELPATACALLEAVLHAQRIVASRVLFGAPVQDFLSTANHLDRGELVAAIQVRVDALRLDEAEALIANGDVDLASTLIEAVLTNTGADVRAKFWAELLKEKVLHHRIFLAKGATAELAALPLATSKRLRLLSRGHSADLRFYAAIYRKAAEFKVLVHRDASLVMSRKAHLQEDDLLLQSALLAKQIESFDRVVAKYQQCLRLVEAAARSPYSPLLATAMVPIVTAVALFTIRLEDEEFLAEAERFRASGFEVCKLIAWIGRQCGDGSVIGQAATTAFVLVRSDSGPVFDWVQESIASIEDVGVRMKAQLALDALLRVHSGADKRYVVQATMRQVYENIAHALGIDLTIDTPRARFLQDAIDDAEQSSTDFFSHCEYLLPSFGPVSQIGLALGLTTACVKILHCTRYGHAMRSSSLTRAAASFKSTHCEGCADRCSRPKDWKFSVHWWEEEQERRDAFLSSFFEGTPHIVDVE